MFIFMPQTTRHYEIYCICFVGKRLIISKLPFLYMFYALITNITFFREKTKSKIHNSDYLL